MAQSQARRLSYTRRDAQSYHEDMSKFLQAFIPRITETSEATEGRLYLTAFEGLIDNANYSLDQIALEAQPQLAQQRKNLLEEGYLADYHPIGVSAATVDGTVSMLSGVAPAGGQSVPIYTRFQTLTSPILEFLSAQTVSILEGTASTTIPLIQGQRTVDYELTAAASGLPYQTYRLPVANTPDAYIEVQVNAVTWVRPIRNDLYDSLAEDPHYYTTLDADNYITIQFGNGVAGGDTTKGLTPPAGARITVTYIQCSLDAGNVPAGSIRSVIGTLASLVAITHAEDAAGGADAESIESIKANIPAHHSAYDRAVRDEDYIYFAERVAGVYRALAVHIDGPLTKLYILPDGGGVASSLLLSTVEAELTARGFEGAVVQTYALTPAHLLLTVNLVLKTSRVQKAQVRSKAKDALDTALYYTNLLPGWGFKLSDLMALFENLDDGTLVEYADATVMTRVPRVLKSNLSAPDIQGRAQLTSAAAYKTYLLQALDTTTFLVTIDGIPEPMQGSVATPFTTSDGALTFTLGVVTDLLTTGDTWILKTSKYRDNLYLDPDEYMALEQDSDLSVAIYYPGEYDFVTQSPT